MGNQSTLIIGTVFGTARIAYDGLLPVMLWHFAVDAVAGVAGPKYLVRAVPPAWREKFTETPDLSYSYDNTKPSGALSRDDSPRGRRKFQLQVNEQQIIYIQQYMKLLLASNEKINLTAIRDPQPILHRHFCESMFAAVAVPVEKRSARRRRLRGGFPGIPPAKLCVRGFRLCSLKAM